ncbi:acyl-CoA carboxylase subunit beta [Candidatus Bathyarchaeota archaeon]|nr:acyl-CoA carboxylase subunit beta [Candidatus Bathyarchaeota archaeon]
MKGSTLADETLDELRRRREELRRIALEASESQHRRGKLSAWERVERLLDPGSFVELERFIEHRVTSFGMEGRRRSGDGVVTGFGSIDGRRVFVYSQDFSFMGGSLGEMHAKRICQVLDLALEVGAPVIGFHDSGGARIQEGVASLAGYGEIFMRNVAASGVIPQIAVIAGPTAGGATYSPALMDFIIMVRGISTMFVTGPRVVKEVTGEEVDEQGLGGADVHSTLSGVASLVLDSEEACFTAVRRLLGYLPQNNLGDPPIYEAVEPEVPSLEGIIPEDPRRSYDVRALISGVFDGGSFFEIQPAYAENVVVGFARLMGRSVGVIASQPRVMAGCMSIDSSDKVARFVATCDAFNIPIITFQDVPGYLPGLDQERGGIIRHGAKVIYAYAEATVPKITIILRKSYGGAYIALGSKHLGADIVYALPSAEIAVLGAEAAVEILYRRELAEDPSRRGELVDRYRREFLNPYQAARLGYIDDVIELNEIREKLIASLSALSGKRVRRYPGKKHGNMPV